MIYKILTLLLLALLSSPAWATSYFLATAAGGGSDSNNGLSTGAPWLTPTHAVNCGDTVTAAAGSYGIYSFGSGLQWGTVTGSGHCVATLQCVTFDACKISGAPGDAVVEVNASHWMVTGWEVSGSGIYASCFIAEPSSTTVSIQDVIFANDIANGCVGAGFGLNKNGTASVDYFAVVGDIAYNAAQSSDQCGSGISAGFPKQADTLPGTHIYIAGNFAWDNVDANPCDSGTPTDGEGVIFDTLSYFSYTAQAVAQNNIFFLNGGRGIEVYSNTPSNVYIIGNTLYGNNTDVNQVGVACGELASNVAITTQATNNLLITSGATACDSTSYYGFWITNGDVTTKLYANFLYSAAGNNYKLASSTSFVQGPNNVTGTSPAFVNPVDPGAPSCGSFASVPACMATVIANFKPTTAAALPYGYQIPSTTSIYDPLYPNWLCNVTLPAGLVTPGCLTGSASAGATTQ